MRAVRMPERVHAGVFGKFEIAEQQGDGRDMVSGFSGELLAPSLGEIDCHP
jgi:hypothetical protein